MFNYTGTKTGLSREEHINNCIEWTNDYDADNSSDVSDDQKDFFGDTKYQYNKTYVINVDIIVQLVSLNDIDVHSELLDSTLAVQMVRVTVLSVSVNYGKNKYNFAHTNYRVIDSHKRKIGWLKVVLIFYCKKLSMSYSE